MKLISIVVLSLSLLLSACGNRAEDKANNNIDSFVSPDTDRLQNLKSSPSGSGRLFFSTPLLSRSSKEHYVLEFRLPEENSEIRLESHMSSFKLSDGFQLLLKRVAQEIVISASSPGLPAQEIMRLLSEKPNVLQRLRFEIHNDVAQGVRLLIWKDKITYDGLTWLKLDKVTEANASFDSQANDLIFFSKGRGIYWGLELLDAEVSIARREAPYVR